MLSGTIALLADIGMLRRPVLLRGALSADRLLVNLLISMVIVSITGGFHVFVVESVILLGKLVNSPLLGSGIPSGLSSPFRLPGSQVLKQPGFLGFPSASCKGLLWVFSLASHSHQP